MVSYPFDVLTIQDVVFKHKIYAQCCENEGLMMTCQSAMIILLMAVIIPVSTLLILVKMVDVDVLCNIVRSRQSQVLTLEALRYLGEPSQYSYTDESQTLPRLQILYVVRVVVARLPKGAHQFLLVILHLIVDRWLLGLWCRVGCRHLHVHQNSRQP